jgi:lysophospholipase L1-like esterase
MMVGTDPRFGAAVKRGLVNDRLLFESEADGFLEVHSLNLYGFRTHDFAIDPPRSRRRILLLGDSLTEGQGASDSATISVAWERLLALDGVRAEVLNLGVVAGRLDHLTRLARDAIPLLQPADVVLVLYANDLPALPFPPELVGPGPPFPRRKASQYMPRVIGLLASVALNEPIYRRWFHPAIRFFPAIPSRANPWTGKLGPPPGLAPHLYQSMAAGRMNPWLYKENLLLPGMLAHDFRQGGLPTPYLRRVAELCQALKANLLVAYVPFYGVTSPRYAPALKRLGMDSALADSLSAAPIFRRQAVVLGRVCAGLGVNFADTTEALILAEAAGEPQFWSYDSHPRPAGYATIAGVIHQGWKRSLRGTVRAGAADSE